MKKTMLRWGALIALLISTIGLSQAQTNLGADCGCPPVAARTTVVNLSTLCDLVGGDYVLSAENTILTCDKIWVIDKKIYVDTLKSITIMPGTLIYGLDNGGVPTDWKGLIVQRGAKIFAAGTEECPIVFTANNDPLDGSFATGNQGLWAGIAILGKATNNCIGTGGTCQGDGVAVMEGFVTTNERDFHGGGLTPYDEVNSGILRHVSVRYTGATLTAGNELQAISLGSVGRGTQISHIEIISSDDDNIELFGGTVNLKYIATAFGNDDMLDWDMGYSGKVQFFFGIKTTDTTVSPFVDSGIEADNDDGNDNGCPRSNPEIYNITLVGNDKRDKNNDESGPGGMMAKEFTFGQICNSVFANFRAGIYLTTSENRPSTTCNGVTSAGDAYDNWLAGQLNITNCHFIDCDYAFRLGTLAGTAPSASDSTKFFTTDGNAHVASLPGFTHIWDMNATTNLVNTQFDVVPNSSLSPVCTTPTDGFFTPAPYRGAFDPNGENWLSSMSFLKVLSVTTGLVPCPTDINGDGLINTNDFLQFGPTFGTSCQ